MELKARSILVEGSRSVIDNGRGHSIVTDLPPKMGGNDTGPTALELVVMGLAGCITTIFSIVAKKTKLEYSYAEVYVEAEKPDDAPTLTQARMKVKVGTNASRKDVEKTLRLTLQNCPVGILLEKAGVRIEVELVEPKD
ncbi:MAG: OsmC family peroxiredoxin [Thermoprotei archaeon]|nr:MAG: OsmC family peroxiredoxin [Thermoprotei archaeon]